MSGSGADAAFGEHKIKLRLYVTGNSPQSVRARVNLQGVCADRPDVFFEIEIVDVLEDPLSIVKNRIPSTPALVKLSPLPAVQVLGDLNDKGKLLFQLGLADHLPGYSDSRPLQSLFAGEAKRS